MKQLTNMFLLCLYTFSLTYFMYCNRDKRENAPKAMPENDYTLNVDSSGYYILDGERLVAHLPFDQNHTLDSVIYKDNE